LLAHNKSARASKKQNTANSAKCVIHMDQAGNIIVELTDLLIGLSVDVWWKGSSDHR